ncbi:MAG TPA: TIGR03790 family protein [Planctomycetes bacterium]|nr:TIGR03790 family protein [Planctomycetota bacterium]
MRIPHPLPLLLLAAASLPSLLPAQGPRDPKRLLLIYNKSFADQNGNGLSDSLDCANYYAKARGVPASNILGITFPFKSRTIPGNSAKAWEHFHDYIVTPLNAKLKALGTTKIDGLVLMYGMPYRIGAPTSSQSLRAVDHLLQVPTVLGSRTGWGFNGWWTTNPYFESSAGVGTDKGHFSHTLYKYGAFEYYLVTRIDGFDLEAALDLIDGALYAEKYGSKGAGKMEGRAYIDTRYGKKPDSWLKSNYPYYPGYRTYGLWDMRMAYGSLWPRTIGLPTWWEPSGKEIGETGAKFTNGKPALSAPDALLYFGWYNYNQYIDVWSWNVGSVASDLDSNSIQYFDARKAPRHGFLTKAMQRGLSAGAGVIAEPYLSGHVRPEIILYYLALGYPFQEASALADPALFWRGVRIGDPLYAPFLKTLTRSKDQSSPKLRWSRIAARAGTSVTLDLAIQRSPKAPELAKVLVNYGLHASMGKSFDPKRGHHARQYFDLPGLDPKAAGYFCQATWTDPVGHTVKTPVFAITPRAIQGVDVHVQGPSSISKNAPLPLSFSVATQGSLSNLTGLKIELRQTLPTAGPWIDITGLSFSLLNEAAFGPEFESLLFGIKPNFPLQGSFEIRISAQVGSKTDSQVLTFSAK